MADNLTKWTKNFLILLFIFTIPLLFIVKKGELVMYFNFTYSDTSTLFFRAVNMLGDGLLFAFIGIPLLFYRFNTTIYFIFLILIQTIIVRIFKDGLSESWPRPIKYLSEKGIDISIAENVDIHTVDSFPSGHATTAFTLALFFMLFMKSTKWQIAIFSLFTIAAVARIYLAQHFLIDVIAGYYCALLTYFLSQLLYDRCNVKKVKGNLISLIKKN